MRTIATILIAITTAAHALLGCCWHHAHEEMAHAHVIEDVATHEHVCQHHDGSAHAIDENHAATDGPAVPFDHGQPCEDNVCVFARVDSTTTLRDLSRPQTLQLPAIGAVLVDLNDAILMSPRASTPKISAPLRAHLVLQILLI